MAPDPISSTVRAPSRSPAPIKAVLFDLDGTLVDSEPNYFLADQRQMARYGITFTEQDKRRYVGGGNLDMMIDMKRRFSLPGTPEELVAEKNAIYLELATADTPLYPEMKRFLDGVRALALPTAVASGSSPVVIERVLEAVGLSDAFGAIVSAEEVGRGKPAPDIFIEAARRLGVPPQACVVVEDSRPGVEAAHRAAMRCIAVPYFATPPLHETFALADLLFADGMATFDADRALAWLAPDGTPS